MSDPKPTVEEVVSSLNGYEEIDIDKQFGAEIAELLEEHPTRGLRSLVYVRAKRRGLDVKAAKDEAMKLSIKDIDDYFADEPIELDPDQPRTDAGKGPSAPAGEPMTSPTGASSPASPPPPTTA